MVDPEILRGLTSPVLAIELLDSNDTNATNEELAWTAYELRETPGGELYFGPRSDEQDEFQGAYSNGMVNLNEQLGDTPAYSLATGGTPHTFARLDEKARLMNKRIQSGRAGPDDPEPLPARSTRGIVLYKKTKKSELMRKLTLEGASALNNLTVNHTEDLTQGMRVDVHLDAVRDSGSAFPSGPSRWRPLTERIVQFSSTDVHPAFLENTDIQKLSYRDHAVITAPTEEKINGSLREEWVWEEEFIWGGGSLAVPSPQNPLRLTVEDLPISITFSLPLQTQEPKRCAPPLRLGRTYRLRARLALPMGCGLTYDDAERDEWRNVHAFPAFGSNEPFIYHRFEEVGAPPILLPWNSPLVREPDTDAHDARGVLAEEVKPSAEELIAGDDWLRSRDRRIAIPARLTIDQAAQQGQHDKRWKGSQKVPAGAFQDKLQLVLCGPSGLLPEARNGQIVWNEETKLSAFDEDEDQEVEVIETGTPRGPVFYPDSSLAKKLRRKRYEIDGIEIPQPRYYPDAWSREMVARLVPVEGFTASADIEQFEFWPASGGPRDALPVQVELRADTDVRGATFTRPSTTRISLPRGGGNFRMRNIAVKLGPGEMIDLELYARCSNDGLEFGHGSYYPVERLDKHEQDIPIVQLVHRRKLRLIHPVKRPIEAPVIRSFDSTPLTIEAEQGAVVGRRDRPQRSLAMRVHSSMTSNDEEGGASTVFGGEIKINGRTTSKLRVEARWKNYGHRTISLDTRNDSWIEDPSNEFANLFDLDPTHDEDICNLSQDPQMRPRGLSFSFSDGRARRLTLKPVASSRFSQYYPPEPKQELGLGQLASTELAGQKFEHWIECTFRPKAPIVDRFIPVLYDAQDRYRRRRTRFTRRNAIRIFLKDWYNSGEGEKLAIVFDQDPNRPLCEYLEDEFPSSSFARLLTRWGRDPTRNTASAYSYKLRPENILGKEVVRGLKLYTGTKERSSPASITNSTMTVDAAIVEPKLDPVLGLYCDIEIGEASLDPAEKLKQDDARFDQFVAGYMPFVTLGLARYQEHALTDAVSADGNTEVDLRLSHVESKTTQILPYRFGEVRRSGRRKVEIFVGGQTFDSKNEETTAELEIRLLASARAAPYPSEKSVWYPVSVSGREILYHAKKLSRTERESRGDGIIWTCEFELPSKVGPPNFAVQIDEYEYLPIVEDPHSAFDSPRFARRGPLFSKFIELG